MKKLLWIGDAGCATGFARATHQTLDTLRHEYAVTVLGLNFHGSPVTARQYPYPIWPAMPAVGYDGFGVRALAQLLPTLEPSVIVIQQDPWNFPEYMRTIDAVCGAKQEKIPVVGAVAVDGENCRGRDLNGLALAIFWTSFGERQARLGGFTGQSAIVPLGCDTEIYRPGDRREARIQLELPPRLFDKFIALNVNRNQPRKRLDLTVSYFAEWVRGYGGPDRGTPLKIDDAFLYFHACPTGEQGYDVQQLMRYYGLYGDRTRLILAQPEIGNGVPESEVALTYNCADVMLTTTQGEGMGLPTLEGMACGIPQILPDHSAYGDWARDGALLVPCTEIACTPNKINVIGRVVDRHPFIAALDAVYTNKKTAKTHNDPMLGIRDRLSAAGLALANRPEYRWSNIGTAFGDAIRGAISL